MKKIIVVLLCIAFSLSLIGCDFDTVMDNKYAQAKEEILTRLNDPDSYVMEYKQTDKKFKNVYKIKFRANNKFGAKVIQYAYAFFDENGKLENLFIESQENSAMDMLVK